MNTTGRLARMLAVPLAMLALLCTGDRPAEATPASGVTFEILSRATVPEFDARRRYRLASDRTPHGRGGIWKIQLEATQMIDIVTVLFTVAPGGHSGWHTHPGPALFTIREGTLTMYDADDPSCTPHVFPAGTGSIEADTSSHSHLLRNETGSPAETVVTFLVPVGALIRTDRPDPGNCPF